MGSKQSGRRKKLPPREPSPAIVAGEWDRGGVSRPWGKLLPLTDPDALLGEPSVWMGGAKTMKDVKVLVLALLASGFSLPQVCDSMNEGQPRGYFPTLPQLMRWKEKDVEFGEQLKFYNQARAAELAEQILWEVQKAAGPEGDLQQMPFLEKKWKAMQWLLERMDSDNWTPKQKIETSAPPMERATLEELRRRLQYAMENPVVREMIEARLSQINTKDVTPALAENISSTVIDAEEL